MHGTSISVIYLLEVLIERFGVKNLELDWFRSYHTGRTQSFTTITGHYDYYIV